MKSKTDRLQKAIIIGATPAGIAAANKLGELGISIVLIEKDANINKKLSDDAYRLKSGVPLNFAHRPGLIRILRNPRIKCILPATIQSIHHTHQGFSVSLTQSAGYVDPERCILCGRCVEICPVSDTSGEKPVKFDGRFSLPGRPIIDKRRLPLCRQNCPLGVNVQGYIALAKNGNYLEALELIRENNILPGICGRVCSHPCEDECRRGELDDPVSIRSIKRFLADYEAQHPDQMKPVQPASKRKERIAVIGSGPAGLAAAAQLAKFGCGVTVFEKEKMAGGMLRYGIGPYRLPRKILDAELAYIQKLGVEFVLSHPVNLSSDLNRIRADFDGVILSTGSWKDRTLGVEGEALNGVEGCLSFLSRLHRGDISGLRGNVAVIGDGNAAFDAARTLIRIGAEVTLISWFEKEKIPADPEETTAAVAEGISIIDKTQVVAFEGENGQLKRLRCRQTKPGVPDSKGIAWPVIDEDYSAFVLEFDNAVVAIGQTGPLTSDAGVPVNRFGYIETGESCQTSLTKVYAAGDAVTGPSTVVHAMSRGRAAANQVLKDICHIDLPPESTKRPEDRDFSAIPADMAIQHRIPMPEKQVAGRKHNFSEVALGLSESQMIFEAGRCLQCGACSECLQCKDVCRAIGAIAHEQSESSIVEQAGVIIIADPEMAPDIAGEDVIRAYGQASQTDVYNLISQGFAAAAQAMGLLSGGSFMQKGQGISFYQADPSFSEDVRIGVFVCSCNQSLGWLDEMDRYVEALQGHPNVAHVETLISACVPEGISKIIRTVRDKALTRMVLGSCVCCSLDFVCSACTDQRSRLKHHLLNATGISRSMVVAQNIRGEALSLLRKNPSDALRKFKGMLSRALKISQSVQPVKSPARNYNFTAAILGESEAAVSSALSLARIGMDVMMFCPGEHLPSESENHPNIHWFKGVTVNSLSGTLGDFKLDFQTPEWTQSIHVGAVILGEKTRKRIGFVRQEGMKVRQLTGIMQEKGMTGVPFFYPGMTSVPGLFLAEPPGIQISNKQKGEAAAVLAAAIMPRGPRKSKGHIVSIDKEVCRNCGRCIEVCPYQAINVHKNEIGGWYASIDPAFCKGCGNCISVCPSSAADSPYRSRQFFEKTLEEILIQ